MSRTDKTRPWRVKVREYGRCRPRLEAEVGQDDRTYYWWHPEFRCGCTLCGYPSQSKKLRAEGKRAIMESLRDC